MSLDVPGRSPSFPDTATHYDDALLVESPFVTVHALVSALRRRWRVWAATSIVGVLTALVFSLASPPPHSATTTLLLRHPPHLDPSRAMATDAELLTTRTVAQRTVDRLDLPLPAKDFMSDYTVTALSDELLSITVHGPASREAVRRTDGLAETFLAFRREQVQRDLDLAVARLEQEVRTVTSELEAIDEEIIELSSAEGPVAPELPDLLSRQRALNDRLVGLEGQIDQITRDASAVVDRSRVVDPARPDDRSPVMAVAINLAAGLVGGLSLGAGWVLLQEVAFDRVRRREDIVATLGAPVSLSVGALRGPLWLQRRRFRRQQDQRGGDVAKMVNHLRASLPHSGTFEPGLVVVSVDSDRPAALAVALTAVDLTKEGTNVLTVDLTTDSSLARLFKVPSEKTSTLRQFGASRLTLAFPYSNSDHNIDNAQLELGREQSDQNDIILVLANLHPDIGAGHLRYWATKVVAVVTAGRSTPTALRSASQLLQASGLEIASTVLVGADPHDDSLGMAPTPPPTRELRTFWAATGDVADPPDNEGEPEDSEGGDPAAVPPASSTPGELETFNEDTSPEDASSPPPSPEEATAAPSADEHPDGDPAAVPPASSTPGELETSNEDTSPEDASSPPPSPEEATAAPSADEHPDGDPAAVPPASSTPGELETSNEDTSPEDAYSPPPSPEEATAAPSADEHPDGDPAANRA